MKNKVVGILACMLLIFATVLPVAATQNNQQQESLTGLAPISASSNMASIQLHNNQIEMTERSIPFFAYNTYDPSGVLVEGPVCFDPSTPGTIQGLGPTSSSSFISGGTWASGSVWNGWYGCEYNSIGSIWTINHVNGIMTEVGPHGAGETLNGLAYDPITTTLYCCSNEYLYTVSKTTGATSFVGSFDISGIVMIGIAFDSSGALYGVDIVTDALYTINPSTGTASVVGPLGIYISFAQDMAFDWDTNTLYLAAWTSSGELYTCNPATGSTTKIGDFQDGAEITCFAIPESHPPTPPQISGPPSGQKNTVLDYLFTSIDPDGDQVSYYIKWDDGNITDWTTFQASGPPGYSESHVWYEQGTYQIKVVAKDTHGKISEWSDEFTVTMPRSRNINSFIVRFLEDHPNIFPVLRMLLGL